MQPTRNASSAPVIKRGRVQFLYALVIAVGVVFVLRAFYLQIVRHDHYRDMAFSKQFKEYEIQPQRGIIEVRDGDKIVPIVLNEKRYTVFADPKYIKDPEQAAAKLVEVLGGDAANIQESLTDTQSRYKILAKKLTKEQAEKIDSLELKGVGTREESYRTYPQGQLASQVLGFVNDEGKGQYGIEQFLDSELRGKPGYLKAITDASGVPLVSNHDNILVNPEQGRKVVLTLDITLQRQVEEILKRGVEASKAKSGSVVIMHPQSGEVKAMANYPTFDPSQFEKVEDIEVFANAAISSPLEVGSIVKTLTAAAAMDIGAVNDNTSYYDEGQVRVDDRVITNVEEVRGAGMRTVSDILELSLNTGAVYLLKQMGGGDINEKARTTWHKYLTKHYQFGKPTGIELAGEAGGTVPDPLDGFGLDVQYANMSFGQGMTQTPLQMAAALCGVVNGGTYYRPQVVDQFVDAEGRLQDKAPEKVAENVVSPEVSALLRKYMENVVAGNNRSALHDGYIVGGKTGTAQIPSPDGGYYADKFNGTYAGYVGGNEPEYVIIVRIDEPTIRGYAGSRAAGPVFSDLVGAIINTIGLAPKD